ncbi:MAG: toxin-antitoxin system YwqK family antitoxin [Fusobacterium sp.]|uniref:toxin-antitoxin system YwqK family antitoxin n=1 Tax=Fusobacterium sp. TaxID=68766 RepID=UPI00399B07BD
MKIYRIGFSFDNDEAMFSINNNFKIENSKFTKEEIIKFLNWIDIKFFSISHEIKMRERKNISIADLEKYITLVTEDKISKIADIIRISGFGDTILLSLKAKEYIQKKYKDKNIEYIEVFYKNIPLYIMNVLESEECYIDNFPLINYEYMLDFSKIKNNDIFRAREVENFKYAIGGIYCNENFKKYIEESDLKGYKFIEIKDINDGIPIVEEKEEYIFKEEPTREFYSNGNLKYEGTIWKGYRVNKWKYYYENGTLKMEGNFAGKEADLLEVGEQTGEWRYYYPSGKLKAIGFYKKGKKNGVFKTYNEKDGTLFLEQYYTTGLEDDLIRCVFYYKNGNVEKEGTAYERNNWEITGEWKYYDEQGKLKRIEIFDKNDLLETKEFD